jgi:hypothetical protein
MPRRRPEPDPICAGILAPQARWGVRIYRTERDVLSFHGGATLVVRRLCTTLVDGAWISSVLNEEFIDASSTIPRTRHLGRPHLQPDG